jgi:hypothetical protein
MIPIGYMAKRVSLRPTWIKADRVKDIYSVSSCVSKDFADYINYWKHNGYWFFDSPAIILEVARDNAFDLERTALFYYEAHELEFDEGQYRWTPFEPETSFTTRVVPPRERALEGYDVATFSAGNSPECSPLSCCSLATDVETNEHCLLPSLERAMQLLEEGRFRNTEPGPHRILAVYSVRWVDTAVTRPTLDP